MTQPSQGTRERAMALAAALSGDYDLFGLSGATPELASRAKTAAQRVLEGPREELSRRIASEMAAVVGGPDRRRIREFWARMPEEVRPLEGLRRLLQVYTIPSWADSSLPSWCSDLRGEDLGGRLAKLSLALLAKATRGERWAVHLTAMGAKLCQASEVSPRLSPAIFWIGAALSRDEESLEILAKIWPSSFGRALLAVPPLVTAALGEEVGEELEFQLKEELSRRG